MTRGLIAATAALFLTTNPALADGDDHDHGGQDQIDAAVTATGVVNSIDAVARKVNLTHEPIPAIGWPAMTMDLSFSDQADLAGIGPGSAIRFTLAKGPDGIYWIDAIGAADETDWDELSPDWGGGHRHEDHDDDH
ncbi:MAG: copper-binding protein [Alphaproteobacteria bacterium]|jgi:Cu/Ag efflux protein CusF|nr:copper-binding protein [Alphaproteobacteria bacterium]MDP6516128.1 copper-binding protein [Alphaproteobacteria bacterium]|tara:strand:+ start:503 stop:910 length:408 start_codon:yes stop_codon:yes gene_type:complete